MKNQKIKIQFAALAIASALFTSSIYAKPDLCKAITTQDMATFNEALDAGVDVNKKCTGNYPIIWAAVWGNVDMIKALAAKGADLNVVGIRNTALTAILEDRASVEPEYLLQKSKENNALIIKRCGGDAEKAKKWLAHEDITRWSSAYDKVKALVELGADINKYGVMTSNPFLYAVKGQHRDIVKMMLSTGKADLKARFTEAGGAKEPTAILIAAENNDFEMVKMLVDAGANVNDQRAWDGGVNVSAVDFAAGYNNAEMQEYLLAKGAKPNPELKVNVDNQAVPAGTYCVALVIKQMSTGLGSVSVSYSCVYANVVTSSEMKRKDIIEAAKQQRSKDVDIKDYQDIESLFFEDKSSSCENSKPLVKSHYELADFRVIHVNL